MMTLNRDKLESLEARAEDVAARLALVSNPKRLLVLCMLSDGEKSVGDIQASLGISQSSLSQHLAKLRAGNVVATRREAQTIYYRIADDQMIAIMQALYETFCGADE